MSNTIETPLPAGVWTNITGSLVDETTYLMQNRGTGTIEIQDSSAPPANDELGILVYARQLINIKPTAASNVYAKPVSGSGKVVITEDT